MKVILSVLLVIVNLLCYAQNTMKAKKIDGKVYIINNKSLYIENGKSIKLIYQANNTIIDITVNRQKEVIVLENRDIKRLNADGTTTSFSHDIYKPFFTSVYTNLNREIWIGTLMSGVYKVKADSLKPFYNVQYVSQITSTKDSSLWIASNIGLHRLHRNAFTVFKEEGTANFEIPDNHVEQLIVDNLGDLWIKMSEAISVFPFSEQNSHGHLPTVKFIGSPENEIYNVSFHKKIGYVISSKEGLLLLPIGNKEDNHKFFEMAEQKAQENPNIDLSIIKKGFLADKEIRPIGHFYTSKNTIQLVDSLKLKRLKLSSIQFK